MVSDEPKKARMFERRLRQVIRAQVATLLVQSFTELVDRAMVEEASMQEEEREANQKKRLLSHGSQFSSSQSTWKQPSNFIGQRQELGSRASQGSSLSATCPRCHKNHLGECRAGTAVCYRCGVARHQVQDCRATLKYPPQLQQYGRGNQTPRGGHQGNTTQARVYSMMSADTEHAGDVVTSIIYMLSHKVVMLVNSSATHSFVSRRFVEVCEI
ncbi:uncharacterized protein LOC131148935 [Malania oleifera]|uniref:uncharacterized protein LOC131148935 n=1 Tax=Malania oleifera TaxID=397392 RepID=UPI0025AE8024|nr:uncharacterized protein LOC131148935 [Malania oleifera]